MTKQRPFFSYFGGKFRAAKHYPKPQYDRIVEPFAGAAGYSSNHYSKDVILIEKDSNVASVWRWLINASADDITSLPDLEKGQRISEVDGIPDDAKLWMGFWIGQGTQAPRDKVSTWGARCYNANLRNKIAEQLEYIKHWTIIEGDYREAPDIEATWFIDPPYSNKAGKSYRMQPGDFDELGEWCKQRQGQVIVCENEGADWLPFEFLANVHSNQNNAGNSFSKEVIWHKDNSVVCDDV